MYKWFAGRSCFLSRLAIYHSQNPSFLIGADGWPSAKYCEAPFPGCPQIPSNSQTLKPSIRGEAFQNVIINSSVCRYYSLTGNIVSKSLQIRNILSIFLLAAYKKIRKLKRCVSDAIKNARAQMAQARKRNGILGSALAASLSAAAVFAPAAASAEDVTPVAQPQNSSVWNEELRALDEAARGAREYAEDNYGVGIVIHVGDESFPNSHFDTAEQFGDAVVQLFADKYQTPAKAFLSPNPGSKATGLTFHVDRLIHGAENGTEVKSVREAFAAMPDIVEQLKIAKELAAVELAAPVPAGG